MEYPDLLATINESPLSRRVMVFCWDVCRVWLSHEEIQHRPTTRHKKWRTTRSWSKYSPRSQYQPDPVPQHIVDDILDRVRNSIHFVPHSPRQEGCV